MDQPGSKLPPRSPGQRPLTLIVQIPCYNEERTLPDVIRSVPRQIAGVDRVEILVVDDGSTDRTVEIARSLGVDHVVSHTNNKGLARAFRTGLDACLALGADVIVNTDGDNQYDSRDIARLIQPILDGTADIVVGDRQTQRVRHFSRLKRLLQFSGSRAVRVLSGTDVSDAVSGFRAISKRAALQLNIVSPFSYTIEMLIQAGRKNLAVASVPVRTNAPTRPSRLFTSVLQFVGRSGATMVRMYAMYKPLATFFTLGTVLFTAGAFPILRFLYFWSQGDSSGHVQSLVLGGVLVILGCVTLLVGLVADLINFNRQLIEMTLEKVRRLERSWPAAQGRSTLDRRASDSSPEGRTGHAFADDEAPHSLPLASGEPVSARDDR
jgi:glycosyltransferase involved in cell wall biosynthesis